MGNWFKLIRFKPLANENGSLNIGPKHKIIMMILNALNSAFIALTAQQTEALNTGNSNEWYTEPGIWLFIVIFIFVIALAIYRKLVKKN